MRIKADYLDMPAFDGRFHSPISTVSGSKLLTVFGDAVALIFHFHFHNYWDETSRLMSANRAIKDHLMHFKCTEKR